MGGGGVVVQDGGGVWGWSGLGVGGPGSGGVSKVW